jgi:phosphohistidine swiveling domain-containing protein
MRQRKLIRIFLISPGVAQGKVVYLERNKRPLASYRGKVVVVHDLDASEIIVKLGKPSGVIAEVGGAMAHGAVLLREYNIPSAVLPNAMRILPLGVSVAFGQDNFLYLNTKIKTSIKANKIGQFLLKRRGEWVMIKPVRREDVYNRFTTSYVQPGFLNTSRVLLGKKMKPELRYTKAGIWVKNHPLPQEIVEKILCDDFWFKKQIKAEVKLFIKLKHWQKKVKTELLTGKKYNIIECLDYIKSCREWFRRIRPYIFLFAEGVDVLQTQFNKLVNVFLSPSEAAKLFSIIGRSAYAESIIRKNIKEPRPGKTAIFIYQPFTIVPAKARVGRYVNLPRVIGDKLIGKSADFRKKFTRYLEVMPIMVELNDEMCYVPRQIITAIPVRFLEPIAETAVKFNLLRDKNDIFKYTIGEIGEMVRSMVKKQGQLRYKKFSIAP